MAFVRVKNIAEAPPNAGDMLKSIYDPNNDGVVKDSDKLQGNNSAYHLDRTNHTGMQVQSTIVNLVSDLASKQATSARLDQLAGISPSDGDFIKCESGIWVKRTTAQLKSDLSLTKSDVGLGSVPNTDCTNASNISSGTLSNSRLSTDLATIAGLSPSDDDVMQRKSGGWVSRSLSQLWTDLKDLTVTLTNKTISGSSNTITNLNASNLTTGTIDTTRLPTIKRGCDRVVCNQFNPANGNTYYFGSLTEQLGQTTTANLRGIPFTSDCTIKKCVARIYVTGAATGGQSATAYIRLNNSTDYTISSAITLSSTGWNFYSNYSMSVSVFAGDYIEFKVLYPTWTGAPTGVYFVFVYEMDT